MNIVAVFTHPWCQYMKMFFGEFISLRIHAAHVFAPGRIQENIPGELFMYWFRARGYVCIYEQRHFIRKIRAPIKIKSALPPPPKTQNTPPLKRGILWTWFFLQNGRIFPGVHKIGAAIARPRIADKHFTDTRIFLILMRTRQKQECATFG